MTGVIAPISSSSMSYATTKREWVASVEKWKSVWPGKDLFFMCAHGLEGIFLMRTHSFEGIFGRAHMTSKGSFF